MNRAHIGLEEFSRATGGRGPAAAAAVREASHVLADGVQESSSPTSSPDPASQPASASS